MVLVFRDITERQRDEAERRKAETLDQLGLLAGGIAHDFNNLLTAIIGNISLVSLLLPPDDATAGAPERREERIVCVPAIWRNNSSPLPAVARR